MEHPQILPTRRSNGVGGAVDTWEQHHEEIARLYATKTLREVQEEMKLRFGFRATNKSWKSQISKWNLDTKKIKPAEYKAMVRIKSEREEESPGKETLFMINGVEVPRDKLERYEVREKRNKGCNGRIGDVVTPHGLTYRTPPPDDLNFTNPDTKAATNTYAEAAAGKSHLPASPKPQDEPKADPNPDPWHGINSHLIGESHSDELAWFKAFFRGSGSDQQAPPSRLIHILLDFAKKAKWQQDEGVDDLLFAKRPPNASWIPLCDERKLLFGLPRIHRLISGASRNWDPKAYRCWTSGAVAMAVAFKRDDPVSVLMIGEMTSRILLDLGDPSLAKVILECTVEEMEGLGGSVPSFLRPRCTLSLARCYFLLDEKDELEELLEESFSEDHPDILKQLKLALREMTALRDLRRHFDEFECILENLQRGNTKISEKVHSNITFLKSTNPSSDRTAELEKVSTKEAERLTALGKDTESRIESMDARISTANESLEERMKRVDPKDRSLPPWKWVDFEMEALVAGIRWLKLHCFTNTLKDHEKALSLLELPECLKNNIKNKGEDLLMRLVLFPLGSQCLDG